MRKPQLLRWQVLCCSKSCALFARAEFGVAVMDVQSAREWALRHPPINQVLTQALNVLHAYRTAAFQLLHASHVTGTTHKHESTE
jgi:hypothetical protein